MHIDTYAAGASASEQTKKEDGMTAKMELNVALWKDDAQHIVYGVVLDPSVTDSQGDDVTKEEIEKACHGYMVASRKADSRHSEEVVKADLIENFIAPQDISVAGKLVKEGSWVAAYKIHDEQLWKEVQDETLTGFSIGGSGVRVYKDGEEES